MKREEYDKVWAEVLENTRKLDTCPGPHDFSADLTPERTLGKKYRCEKCGGEVDSVVRSWYNRGVEHGKRQGVSE